jgi:uncharacterized protein (DUF2336 family)
MGTPLALIRELDSTIAQSSDIRRAAMLRQLTDFFLVGAQQYSDDEISLIDDVFMRLVVTIEETSRALLAIRLGPAPKAPPKILRLLACDDAIEIASPVLSQSEQLDTPTLIECAKTKSQEHLLAITCRKSVPEVVTDVLVERGDQQIVLSIARNVGARFSDNGFSMLVKRARGDDELASCVGSRPDIPPQLFEQLLEAASEAVRTKLENEHKYATSDINRVVSDVTSQIQTQAITHSPGYAAAQVLVNSLNEAGQLNAGKLDDFARTGRFEEIVAALSVMANTPAETIERILNDKHAESLWVLAKAIGLPWETTRGIVVLAAKKFHRMAPDLEKSMSAFQRLSRSTAQRIFDFHRMQARTNTTRVQ